jgi:putative transcriptional regulator
MLARNTAFFCLIVVAAITPGFAGEIGSGDESLFNSLKHPPQLSRGAVLIAGKNLHDHNFSRTVVLITEYNELGTTGLIINRPLNMAAQKVLPQIDRITPEAGNLYIGGPVGVNNLQILVQTGHRFQQYESLTGDIYLINNPRTFSSLAQHDDKNMKLRIYVGYAGWGTGQLESEIIRGDWHIWHADSKIVFSESPESIWPELIELVTVQWAEYNL